MIEQVCPDCKHKIEDHDMYGCTLYACHRWPNGGPCTLSGEFLIAYFAE